MISRPLPPVNVLGCHIYTILPAVPRQDGKNCSVFVIDDYNLIVLNLYPGHTTTTNRDNVSAGLNAI